MVTVQERAFFFLRLFAKCLDFFRCVRVGISSAVIDQFLRPLSVNGKSIGLAIRCVWSTQVRAFIVLQPKCLQTGYQVFGRACYLTVLIGVFQA